MLMDMMVYYRCIVLALNNELFRVRCLPQSSIWGGPSKFLRDLEKTDAKLSRNDAMLAAQSLAPALQYS